MDAFCLRFASACVIGKNLNTSNWNSMTDDTITRSKGIEVLGFPFLNCEQKSKISFNIYSLTSLYKITKRPQEIFG